MRQDTDTTGAHGLGGMGDYTTSVDFDGDWDVTNNWENLSGTADLRGACYYAVTETRSHWFILYGFYHPRDWSDDVLTWFGGLSPFEHQNDMEGVLIVVRRPVFSGDPIFGRLEGMVSIFHTGFRSFVCTDSFILEGRERLVGSVTFETVDVISRPVIGIEAKGHGIKAAPYVDIKGDGVVYVPSMSEVVAPTGPDDRAASYRLVDIFAKDGLWARRNSKETFESFGNFRGGGANAPWGWDDPNREVSRGEIATDPAKVAAHYFNIPGLSREYTINRFSRDE